MRRGRFWKEKGRVRVRRDMKSENGRRENKSRRRESERGSRGRVGEKEERVRVRGERVNEIVSVEVEGEWE